MKIYTDSSTSVDITVSEGNKWYTYVLPKDKGLFKIVGDSVKKVVVKADINYKGNPYYYGYGALIPRSTIEVSLKGSNTSKVTNMDSMFNMCSGLTSLDVSNFDTSNVTYMFSLFIGCSGLISLDLSGWNTSKVTNMDSMFSGCTNLTSLDLSGWNMSKVNEMNRMFANCISLRTIRMVGCNQTTIDKISSVMPSGAHISTE